ncbi:hypothetical protein CBR_g23144 [Chara braunii]|uniref:Cationic amino acid transporter C-terminal domain-containing protein n=1 Tax=Chara braunii TaxID=69332 RepID=A0A388L3Q0_CHABU|nr:hypothetical protein CBR_g23144 [Chara braunii]|eukprot:GBG76930.1 hypothetical protein CBR_g23144 [Chara braunii]
MDALVARVGWLLGMEGRRGSTAAQRMSGGGGGIAAVYGSAGDDQMATAPFLRVAAQEEEQRGEQGGGEEGQEALSRERTEVGHDGYHPPPPPRPPPRHHHHHRHYHGAGRDLNIRAEGGSYSGHHGDHRGQLVRSLGPFELVLMGIGASIGSGIFVVTGVAAQQAGPGVILSYAIAGAACIVDALCYAECAARFPAVSGGAYLYTLTAFNGLAAFVVFCNLLFDYHIGAASIARSLAGYVSSMLVHFWPDLGEWLPLCLTAHGMPLMNGVFSINLFAPLILAAITLILCQGVKEFSAVNGAMTMLKVAIVVLVILTGSAKVDPSNWFPFAPNGIPAILSVSTTVFFAYVGFDAVANTAEESKNPQRDLPIGILGSMGVCMALYIGVCLVLTGMVRYDQLDKAAPIASAFVQRGAGFITGFIYIGAIIGLTTTLLIGMYAQSRLYLGIGRDGLLPKFFAILSRERKIPVIAQIWVGVVSGVMALLFDIGRLSRLLSVGVLLSYGTVCCCVVVMRICVDVKPHLMTSLRVCPDMQTYISSCGGASNKNQEKWWEAVACMTAIAVCAFLTGLCTRYSAPLPAYMACVVAIVLSSVPLITRQAYCVPSTFACPMVPILPLLGMSVNVYLLAQLHVHAWVRLVTVVLLAVAVYMFYGRHSANPGNIPVGSGTDADMSAPIVEHRRDIPDDHRIDQVQAGITPRSP